MLNKTLIKVQRVFAYFLFAFAAIQLFTGFIQVGIIDIMPYSLANMFHRMYILIPLVFLGTVHSFIGIRMALYRRKIRNMAVDVILIVIGLILIIGVIPLTLL